MLKGDKAVLLAEGCKINKEKKKAEKRLAEIKKEIGIKAPGTYVNKAGDELVIAETEKWSDISPKKVLDYLKKNRLSNRFPEVVKVQMAPLKKLVPETIIEKWRFPLDSILRWTWK
jgi:hypothetical protein